MSECPRTNQASSLNALPVMRSRSRCPTILEEVEVVEVTQIPLTMMMEMVDPIGAEDVEIEEIENVNVRRSLPRKM
eukprot:353383-Amphidinium_carterae.1